ncbi:MAG: DeoR/GlpR transcriptional regulator, partial [Oscillospiraceae bacterium]|nr:DeoR/GlpR transcriptional regulator [Oscillospiraceae bacterium]
DKGMTTEYFSEVGVNNQMLQNVSGPVFLLASHVKLNWDSNFVSGPIDYVSKLITDKGAPSELIASFEALDIEVFQV